MHGVEKEKHLSLSSISRHNSLGAEVVMESHKFLSWLNWLARSRSVNEKRRRPWPGHGFARLLWWYVNACNLKPLPVNIIAQRAARNQTNNVLYNDHVLIASDLNIHLNNASEAAPSIRSFTLGMNTRKVWNLSLNINYLDTHSTWCSNKWIQEIVTIRGKKETLKYKSTNKITSNYTGM